jgi:hypothetical protein
VRLASSPIFKVFGGAADVVVVVVVLDVDGGGAEVVVVVLDVDGVDVVVEHAESVTVKANIRTSIKLTISVENFALFTKSSL